jgi:flagellar basal-body rod protein FlgC
MPPVEATIISRDAVCDARIVIQGAFIMISGLGSTLSSLQAHNRKMSATADNVANVNTNGFKRNQAVLAEGASGDVQLHLRQDRSPAPFDPLAPDAPGVEKELSNVDLADEMSGMLPTEIGYKANLKTIRAHDAMIGSLLDTLA